MKFSWKNFPEMLLIHDPKSEILKKAWKNFPRNPLSDHPVFGNIFQDLAIWVKVSLIQTEPWNAPKSMWKRINSRDGIFPRETSQNSKLQFRFFFCFQYCHVFFFRNTPLSICFFSLNNLNLYRCFISSSNLLSVVPIVFWKSLYFLSFST